MDAQLLVGDCTVLNVPLMATASELALTSLLAELGRDTGTAVAGLAGGNIENKSLLFNGSKAD